MSKKIVGAVFGLLLFLSLLTSNGQSLTNRWVNLTWDITWDQSVDPNVTGYAVYVISLGVTNRLDVGNVQSATVSNLTAGVTYSFYVTAYNVWGIESDPSNIITYTVPFPPAIMDVSPTGSFAYGTVVVGLSSNKTFQVVNSGGSNLVGTAVAGAPFAVTGGGAFNIPPGSTGFVQVIFAPFTDGSVTGSVAFVSNGGNSTNILTGVGVTPAKLAVIPGSISFGTVSVGGSAQLSFIVTNQGGLAVTSGTANVGLPWSIVSGTPFTLNGFSAKTLTVRFAPTVAGNFTGNVSLTSSNGGSANVSLIGTGAITPIANFNSPDPTNGIAPFVVTFVDTSTGTITNRFWNFGDGTSVNISSVGVSHSYTVSGTNTVSLTVSGPLGSNTKVWGGIVVFTKPLPPTNLRPGNLSIYSL